MNLTFDNLWLQSKAYHTSRFLRSLENRIRPGAIILLYHRISAGDFDPYHLNVSPENFSDQMAVIRELAIPISLGELVARMESGGELKNRVVVTFDDGYACNLETIKEALSTFEMHSTFFIVDKALNPGFEFWWDELERLMVSDAVDRESAEWDSYVEICERVKPLSDAERSVALGDLRDRFQSTPRNGNSQALMTQEQITQLASEFSVSIGSHTRSHANLSSLEIPQQSFEILESKLNLQSLINQEIFSFSYPYGQYNRDARRIVETAGLSCACTVIPGSVGPNTDPFALPRLQVGDWNRDEFTRFLRRWIV